MTNEQKLAALEAKQLLALAQKIPAIKIINLLENKQVDIREIATGKLGGRGWFSLQFLKKKTECLCRISKDYASMHGNPPMELRIALAKVFRKHYEIEEAQND